MENESIVRKHQHLILRGSVLYPPNDPAKIEIWLKELVSKIKMNILMGPWATYSPMVGNRGLTGVVVIETSHIAVHVWDECEPGIIELDIFSCKDFVVDDVIQHMKQFGLTAINFRTVDRTDGLKDEKLFVVYETTNKINDKIYVGVHGGFVATDDYLGSGKALKAAIKKYGKENFEKQIIKIFNTAEEAYAFEKEIVDYEFIQRDDTYNLAVGGSHVEFTEELRDKISLKRFGKKSNMKWITNGSENMLVSASKADELINDGWVFGRYVSEKTKNKQSLQRVGKPSHRKGKTLPEEQKQKIRESMKQRFAEGYVVHNSPKKQLDKVA